MLTSMLLSQEVNFEGDVEDFVQQMTRHRSPVRPSPPPLTLLPPCGPQKPARWQLAPLMSR